MDDFARWELIGALTPLDLRRRRRAGTTLAFLDRFEREPLADPDDVACKVGRTAISLLGIERDARAADRRLSGRSLRAAGGRIGILPEATHARAQLGSGDAGAVRAANLHPIDDPAEALKWLADDTDVAPDFRAGGGRSIRFRSCEFHRPQRGRDRLARRVPRKQTPDCGGDEFSSRSTATIAP